MDYERVMVETESYTESNEDSLIDSRPRSASLFPGIRAKNVRVISNVSTGEYVAALQQGSSNTLVAVRVRPFSKREVEANFKNVVKVLSANLVVLLDVSTEAAPEEAFRVNRSKEKQFAFDIVLDSTASQADVYANSTSFLVEGVLNGYNATVFAYGATGAGKTFTMLGTLDSPGVMPNALSAMFEQIAGLTRDREYQVKICYLEIYNETIRDLISPSSDVLEIREDPVKGVQVAGLTEILASTPEEVIRVMHLGNKQRTTEPTAANETSSRSHAVLQITVEYKDRVVGLEADIIVGKLSMIDLAGSERAAVTNNRGMRLIEGANINRSLLALGNCINALCEANEKGLKLHVRYRDSKLTRLLKDSLGGNCRTVMVACIAPAAGNYEDTLNTLKYANRAKNIKTDVQRNVFNVSYHISKYAEIIEGLKGEIQELRAQMNTKGKTPSVVSVPTPSIEKHLIELNAHFSEEAKLRKHLQEVEQSLSQLGFALFDKQRELVQLKRTHGEDAAIVQRKVAEIDSMLKNLKGAQKAMEADQSQLAQWEGKREGFSRSWRKAGLREAHLAQLQATLDQLITSMTYTELTRKGQRTESKLKQQTQYINSLKDQVVLRDNIITEQTSLMRKHNLEPSPEVNRLMSINEIEVSSKVAFSRAALGPVRSKVQGNVSVEQLLPGQSRIPSIKSRHDTYGSSVPPRKATNVQLSPLKRDSRPSALRGSKSGAASPDLMHTEKPSPVARGGRGTVAEKIASSPYVRSNKPALSPHFPKSEASSPTRGRKK